MGTPLRIGMLTPSSNTVLEPMTYHLLRDAADVSVHFSRLPVTTISLDNHANDQFSHERILVAATLLRDAGVDVLAWNGTAGSWLGVEADRSLCAALTSATGVPSTTSTLALLDAFRAFGVTRLGLVTPYTSDVTAKIARAYAAEGVEVTNDVHLGLTDNRSFGEVGIDRIEDMIREAAADGVHAVALVCTNLRGALATGLEARLGIPVLDSVSATLWKTLDQMGVDLAVAEHGSLLRTGTVRSRLQSICGDLLARTTADRTTIRLDLPAQQLAVDLAAAEATRPGVPPIRHDSGLDQRRLNTVAWLERERRTLIQPHFRADPQPPSALIDTYGVQAQMLAPVVWESQLAGWLSVHSSAERKWQDDDVAAIESAAAEVRTILRTTQSSPFGAKQDDA